MYDYHVLLGAASIGLGVTGYFFYFRSIFRGITKPHIFTWFTYGVLDIIVFFAQIVKGAGPGAWPLAFSVVACFAISATALRWGEKRITKSDWLCFLGSVVAIACWLLTSNPLSAVIIAVIINALALIPTFRKSYIRPYEESVSMWGFDIAKYALSIFALSSINPTTALFPLAIVVCNSILVIMILLRRRQMGTVSQI